MKDIKKYGEDFFNNLKYQIEEFEKKYNGDNEAITRIYFDSSKWTIRITKGTKCRSKEYDKNLNRFKKFKHDSFIDKALMKTFSSHEYRFANEYYHIDNLIYENVNGGYEPADKNMYKINKHRWRLLAAVEHENDKKDWTDELVKLMYINCDFRCVIGYGDFYSGYENQKNIANEIFGEIMKSAKVQPTNYVTEKQQFLLIFGPRVCDIEKANGSIKLSEMFKGFIYDSSNEKFKELNS